ncbi:type II toxin-antitoxin system RelE/ParE family toxin [Pseudomonas cedrina]|uniref:type II toxin-antitoxin system RelE/ParE family toxin n=1 Tax=Pseudomonas cedrina TaxID=651740 RepID=UPI003EDA0525
MSYSVVFAPQALAHLDALEAFISEAASAAVAARFVDKLISHCESFSLFPLRGTRRDDLLTGLRITHYRCTTIIAFTVNTTSETVSILGVFYGGQSYAALFQPWKD